jgi:hypothetical protein
VQIGAQIREEKKMERAASQVELANAWLQLFQDRGFLAMSFLTFTFDPKRWKSISPHKAMGLFKWWLVKINRDLGGKNYKRRCKHSLISYAVGVDYHKSGDVHLHAVIDGWFDYSLARRVWGDRCGFLGIDRVTNSDASLRHVLKYIRKGDDFGPSFWFNKMPVRDRPAGRSISGKLGFGGACQGFAVRPDITDRQGTLASWQDRADMS